jgi:hypothetical protein
MLPPARAVTGIGRLPRAEREIAGEGYDDWISLCESGGSVVFV